MSNRTQRRSSSLPMPKASCCIVATVTIFSVRSTRSTSPRRMPTLNSISTRSARRAMNCLNRRRTLSARAVICVWPRSSRRRQWSISYHTLYYVYHGLEFDSHDPVIMHDRMRTLSTKLMLAFDDTHIENIFTLPRLKSFLMKAPYGIRFDIAPQKVGDTYGARPQSGRDYRKPVACGWSYIKN